MPQKLRVQAPLHNCNGNSESPFRSVRCFSCLTQCIPQQPIKVLQFWGNALLPDLSGKPVLCKVFRKMLRPVGKSSHATDLQAQSTLKQVIGTQQYLTLLQDIIDIL